MPYGVYTAGVAGDEVSSTYEGRHLTFSESQLTHPSHTDGFVDAKDPVLVGENIVGVAFTDAAAATDLIAIDTEGIWQLSVIGTDQNGNSAVVVGDEIYINKTTALLSKNYDKNVSVRYGVALYPVGAGSTTVIPVKVHGIVDDELEQVGTSSVYRAMGTALTIARQYRYISTATSGDIRGIYNRLQFGANGTQSGESLRSYTEAVGFTCGTLHGAHISLGFGESTTGGAITGLGVAVRATLGLPSVAMAAGGTYAAVMAEIYSFGAAADPAAVTRISFIRVVNGGDGTGIGKVDDKAYLLDLNGFSVGAGNVFVASATEANYAYAARCYLDGVGDVWLMFASASG